MTWLIVEMWALLLAAFLVGGGFGFWVAAGRSTRRDIDVAATNATAPSVLLDRPDGQKDDLTQIIGVDGDTEKRLNALGVFHFSQIASWDEASQRWIEIRLNEPGRVIREQWTEQAISLG
ncbi:MAG: hypothetical protein R3C60_12290 [Parvularculaceae bacterium]